MKIKVCGITGLAQMQQLQQMGVDYAGMIFYEGSRRFVGDRLEEHKAALRNLPVKKVGVFVNADYETIVKAIKDYGLSAVQLHGDETDEFCLELMDRAEVIKVFRINGGEDIEALTAGFQNVCHYFLFDTAPAGSPANWRGVGRAQPSPKENAAHNSVSPKSGPLPLSEAPPSEGFGEAVYGGTGQQFNWAILEKARIDKPFFLSGGIGLEDIAKIKTFHHPCFYAVDVNSRFETAPGVKDMTKVQQFLNALNHE